MNIFEKELRDYNQFPTDALDVDWIPFDSQERFDECLKNWPDSIHLQNYLKNPIKYKLNKYGFRTSSDFSSEKSGNVFLGCSHTFGIGHHLENTWSYILSQKIGGEFYNISEPSSGVMTQYRLLKYFDKRLNFKNVFHFLPEECWERYEYPIQDGNDTRFVILQMDIGDSHSKTYKNWISDVILNEKFYKFNNMVYIDAIKNICKENGANYYLITKGYRNVIDPYHKTMTPARDIEHYYVEEQQKIAESFYKKYKPNLI